jgi:TIR domain
MADVFISYAKAQRRLAEGLAREMSAASFSVWWDTNLLPNQVFRSEIDKQLDCCKATIVIWTPDSIASEWVLAEADHAHRQGKLINTHSPELAPDRIPKPFGQVHSVVVDNLQGLLAAVSCLVEIGSPVKRNRPRTVALDRGARPYRYVPLAALLLVAGIISVWGTIAFMRDRFQRDATRTEHLVCTKPEAADAPTFSLEIASFEGLPTEIRIPAPFGSRRYKVTMATEAAYAADELEPETPDSIGTLFLDRTTGKLTQVNKISLAAVSLLVQLCDGKLSREACTEEMVKTKGGNGFACFELERCAGWRDNSNVLAVHFNACARTDRKF